MIESIAKLSNKLPNGNQVTFLKATTISNAMFREDDMKLKVRSKGINQEPVFEVLKCKWTILILANIIEGLSRPSQLKRAIPGITAKVLSERLKRLERSGIVKRKSFSGYPLHVEYLLDLRGKN